MLKMHKSDSLYCAIVLLSKLSIGFSFENDLSAIFSATGRVRNIKNAVETSGMIVSIEKCLMIRSSAMSFTLSTFEI